MMWDPSKHGLGRLPGKLKPFKEILEELLQVYPDFPLLPKRRILELGPGRNLNLLIYLKDCSGAESVRGVGRTARAWWRPSPGELELNLVEDQYILPYLQALPTASLDLIYSRHVLEQHSIDARILLRDPVYKAAIASNSFADLPESFPASIRNIGSIFSECYRILKPGGVLITQVARRKFAVLSEAGLRAFAPRNLKFRRLGSRSEISTFVK